MIWRFAILLQVAPLANGASPIAYYLDSVPWGFVKSGFVPDADIYDLERIEVLRGPQGTLYGASTSKAETSAAVPADDDTATVRM